MEEKQLRAAIRAAFQDVPYPGDNKIGDPEGRDDAESVTEWLRGVNWRTVARRKDLGPLGLYFMTPEAAHYYLPAYLLVVTKNPFGQAMRAVKLRLRPNEGPHLYPKEIFARFVSLLSPEQKAVVREFLIFSIAALEEYFRQRGEKRVAALEEEGRITPDLREETRAFWKELGDAERADLITLLQYWRSV
jgi:hypothetical protein